MAGYLLVLDGIREHVDTDFKHFIQRQISGFAQDKREFIGFDAVNDEGLDILLFFLDRIQEFLQIVKGFQLGKSVFLAQVFAD
ncbi:hypothetical protein D3C81_2078380 [compost metagenome]